MARAVLAHKSNRLAGRNEGGYVGEGRMDCQISRLQKAHLRQSIQVDNSGRSLLGQFAAENCLRKEW